MGSKEQLPRVCGKKDPYPCMNTVLRYYEDQLESGERIPVVSCPKCGWVWMPGPKCPEPSCAEPPDKVAPEPKKQVPRGPRNRKSQIGRCVNCKRKDIHIAAYGQCDYCYYSVDKVEAAWKAVNGWARRTALKMHPDIRERFVKKHYGGSRALPEVWV